MSTFVLVHGAWHGAWCWERVVPMLQSSGHDVVVPTLTGLGERAHELSPSVGFDTHVEDIVEVLDDLGGSVLVGHSYAGLVVREAADRLPEKVESIVLVDGWAGSDGTSLFDLAPEWFVDGLRTAARKHGDGSMMPAPAPALVGVTGSEDVAWLHQRLVEQPLRTFEQKTQLTGEVDRIPGTAIICEPGTGLPFKQFADALGYRQLPIESGHDAMVSAPLTLTAALLESVAPRNLQDPETPHIKPQIQSPIRTGGTLNETPWKRSLAGKVNSALTRSLLLATSREEMGQVWF